MNITTLPDAACAPQPDAGLGAISTERGNLPLEAVDVQADITGLIGRTSLTQAFRNAFDVPLEATYVFPLPDRAAVTSLRMQVGDRVVEGVLKERGQAREDYDAALAQGKRAAIAEEDRPEIFTLRAGNVQPGERIEVRLTITQPLPYEDGAALYRFPLVVAPRYIPGAPLPGDAVGDGSAPDTDAVPDASRITPPVLLPGFPLPVRLSLNVSVDPAGLPLKELASSLHTVEAQDRLRVSLRPGERLNRDFMLRLVMAESEVRSSLVVSDDGTLQLTVVPPDQPQTARARDVVLIIDRSGSMTGWKMVAARRAAARIVDTLTLRDRFAVLAFDNVIERPAAGLAEASDRNRFRAVEFLARLGARGGTEMLAPLQEAASTLAAESARDRVIVLVTDGQVGNEDQLLAWLTPRLSGVRVHTVGIDRAVNAGLLNRLASLGGGRCELVESEDRLDAAMDDIHRRIGSPVLTDLRIEGSVTDVAPQRLPSVFPGVPLVVSGRGSGALTLHGLTASGSAWSQTLEPRVVAEPAITTTWARARLRDLEDRYVAGDASVEEQIVATSLTYGVLCRFTAFVAVDTEVTADGREVHRVIQPVEPASGWDQLGARPPAQVFAAGPMMTRGFSVTDAFAGRAAPPPQETAPPQQAVLRARLSIELDRLRKATPGEEPLAELLRVLREIIDGGQAVPELVTLAAELERRELTVDERWRRAIDLLSSLSETPERRAFWRLRPMI